MLYEKMLLKYSFIPVEEDYLEFGFLGLYSDGRVLIHRVQSFASKVCIVVEEFGHHFRTVGNIILQISISDRKQEELARRWAYDELVPLDALVRAKQAACANRYEIAEFLGITEEFLERAIEYYSKKYGLEHRWKNYLFKFNPLQIIDYSY